MTSNPWIGYRSALVTDKPGVYAIKKCNVVFTGPGTYDIRGDENQIAVYRPMASQITINIDPRFTKNILTETDEKAAVLHNHLDPIDRDADMQAGADWHNEVVGPNAKHLTKADVYRMSGRAIAIDGGEAIVTAKDGERICAVAHATSKRGERVEKHLTPV